METHAPMQGATPDGPASTSTLIKEAAMAVAGLPIHI